jgi:hypothetical protein
MLGLLREKKVTESSEYLDILESTVLDRQVSSHQRAKFINFPEHFLSMFDLAPKTREYSTDMPVVIIRPLEEIVQISNLLNNEFILARE